MAKKKGYREIAKELIESIEGTLELDAYNSADLSDIGNEVGLAIGKYISEKRMGYEYSSFIHGFNHGIELNRKRKKDIKKNGKKKNGIN
jgi:hypothetical protein